MKKVLFGLMVLLAFASGCKKDKSSPATVTPTVASISGSYKLVKIMGQQGANTEQDVTDAYLDDCEKDDVHKLNADLTYEWVDAGTHCEESGPYESTWKLNSSTSIEIDEALYNIKKFDGKNFVLGLDEAEYNTKFTFYYVKQ